jgi:acyl-CoA synthetase (NDP forming)
MAVISTPIKFVPQIIKDCVDVGVGSAVIISAGGKEIGEQGKKLEADIQKEAKHSGLRIIGPNGVGILRVKTFEELFDCAELPAKQAKPAGPGLAIITNKSSSGESTHDRIHKNPCWVWLALYWRATKMISLAHSSMVSRTSDKNALNVLGPDILNFAMVSAPSPILMLNISTSSV